MTQVVPAPLGTVCLPRGVTRLFKMRGQQGGAGDGEEGLTGTQNGGSPQPLVQNVILFGGLQGGGGLLTERAQAPQPPLATVSWSICKGTLRVLL